MDLIRALIVDDERLGRQIIREFLDKHPDVQILAECQDAHEALAATEKYAPDLLFLDIQMPEVNGFELLEMLDVCPTVIFCTAYDQYALRAFEVNAVDYLLKPIVQDRFDLALARAKQNIRQKKDDGEKIDRLLEYVRSEKSLLDRMLVKQSGKIVVIQANEIRWIEAVEDYVNLHTPKGSFLVLQSLSHLETRLDPGKFIRIHRSTIVNMDFVDELEPWPDGRLKCTLKDRAELITSRSGAKRLRKMML